MVADRKAARNRRHAGTGLSGGRAVPIGTRRQRADAYAGCLAGPGAGLAGVLNSEGPGHNAIAMKDPEGSELDIN